MSLDEKAMEIERISVNLHEYSNALSATQEAMRDWLAEGDNILEFWLEYNDRMNQGAAMLDGSLRQMQRMERAADFRALV
ncbi:hypothetical protein, partial [Pseudomonas sp. AH2 (2023)]|uniref:hypothetical protein n=1 Tax=Pseudomonas sp. AH2 (2023) TaxID=3048599 RepID=UPI002B22983C